MNLDMNDKLAIFFISVMVFFIIAGAIFGGPFGLIHGLAIMGPLIGLCLYMSIPKSRKKESIEILLIKEIKEELRSLRKEMATIQIDLEHKQNSPEKIETN